MIDTAGSIVLTLYYTLPELRAFPETFITQKATHNIGGSSWVVNSSWKNDSVIRIKNCTTYTHDEGMLSALGNNLWEVLVQSRVARLHHIQSAAWPVMANQLLLTGEVHATIEHIQPGGAS